jgi:uncharacterized SAM-binding protein YcdF (DUF218 family)
MPDAALPPTLDGLIVLGARVNPQGQPGRVARLRLAHALLLWRSFYPGSLVFLSGGQRPGAPVSEAAAMASWADEWAAAHWPVEIRESLAACLILEETSHNTAASARNLLALAREKKLAALGLVTDALHMSRARFLFRRHFRRHGIAVHPFPVPGVLQNYWQRGRYLWLGKMALREGGAWLKVLGDLARERRRLPKRS